MNIPSEHTYDRIAVEALSQIFPKNWQFKSSTDIFSGREYSEDLVIEIVDKNGNATGFEFGIQNKLGLKKRIAYIALPKIKIATIKRLVDLNRPIMVHAFDVDEGISYWLWLEEWFTENYKAAWENQKTTTIQIPYENVLTSENLSSIVNHVKGYHLKQRREALAERISQGPDWYVRTLTDADLNAFPSIPLLPDEPRSGVGIVIEPKHEDAVPEVTPLTEEVHHLLQYAVRTGLPIVISGDVSRALSIDNIPELLSQDMSLLDKATAYPLVPEQTVPISIHYLQGQEVVFEFPYIAMKWIRYGSEIQQLQGAPKNWNVEYTFTNQIDENGEHIQRLEWRSGGNHQYVRELQKTISFLDQTSAPDRVSVAFLEDQQTIYFDVPRRNLDLEILESARYVAGLLASIEEALSVEFILPAQLEPSELSRIEFVAKVVTQGLVRIRPEVLFGADDLHRAREGKGLMIVGSQTPEIVSTWVRKFKEQGHVSVPFEQPFQFEYEVLGQTLQLGRALYLFVDCEILNIGELEEALSKRSAEQTELEVVMGFDPDKLSLVFENWVTT